MSGEGREFSLAWCVWRAVAGRCAAQVRTLLRIKVARFCRRRWALRLLLLFCRVALDGGGAMHAAPFRFHRIGPYEWPMCVWRVQPVLRLLRLRVLAAPRGSSEEANVLRMNVIRVESCTCACT